MNPAPRTDTLAWASLAAGVLTGAGLVLVVARHTLVENFADVRRVADPTFAVLALTIVLGAWTFARARHAPGNDRSRWLALFSMIGATGGFCGYLFFLAACNGASSAHARALSLNKLMQIGLAFYNYDRDLHVWPGPAITAPDGRPLLSWRVAIMPYVNQEALYKEFHLDEPWDSPHNLPLLHRMPDFYRLPFDATTPQHVTYYQVFVGPGTACERAGLRWPEDFPDGIHDTIVAAEAAEAVPWTKPADLVYDPTGPLPALGPSVPLRFSGFNRTPRRNVLLCDHSTRTLRTDLPDSVFRAIITRNGGEPVPKDW